MKDAGTTWKKKKWNRLCGQPKHWMEVPSTPEYQHSNTWGYKYIEFEKYTYLVPQYRYSSSSTHDTYTCSVSTSTAEEQK